LDIINIMIMQENIFEKDYKIYLVCFFIILALPFVNFQPWLSPPAWGKAIIFRIIISFFIYIFLYRVIAEKKYNIFKEIIKNKIVILLLILLLLYLLATVFSLDPRFSFWGSPLRSGGSLNYILFIIFAVLAFLIIKKKDWKKLWDFSFLIGVLVTLVALAQKLRIFSGFIIPHSDRAIGTMGGAPFLALYLCLLLFMAFSFGINTAGKKKWLYFASSAFFIFGVILSGSRGAILGVLIGFLFYVLFYPSQKIRLVKIASLGFLALIVLGLWILNSQPSLVAKIEQNKIAGNAFERVWSSVEPMFNVKSFSLYDISSSVFKDRTASWIISIKALKEKPLLGYGPENFSIAFDKYYNMSLPGLNEGTDWWDRAHNFIFDISVAEGVPALVVFLLLFIFLFLKLQKNKSVLKHGLQATFIVYLINNLFNFDVFSTFLLFFFSVAFALYLTSEKPNLEKKSFNKKENPFRTIAFVIAFILLLSFMWFGALKPLWINKEINVALSYLEQGRKDLAIQKMENVLTKKSNIRNYTLLQYVEIVNISMNIPPAPTAETRLQLTQKTASALKESVTLRPYYTRSWWALNIYTNYFLGVLQNPSDELKQEAVGFCQKARELSPGHWKIIKDCTTTYLTLENYDTALEAAQKCLDVKPDEGICWIRKAMAHIGLGNIDEAKKDIEEAKNVNYPEKYDLTQRSQIVGFYNSMLKKDTINEQTRQFLYQELITLYQDLIAASVHEYNIDSPQYHASLAYIYEQAGNQEKAREEASIVLKLAPEAAKSVDEFLKNFHP
jgi:tetratricopeptide (TPR) repeat protein